MHQSKGNPLCVFKSFLIYQLLTRLTVAEEKFALSDPVGEAKYGVTLKTALERARTSRGTLLKGKVFYITPKVQVGPQLIRSLIVSLGGSVRPHSLLIQTVLLMIDLTLVPSLKSDSSNHPTRSRESDCYLIP